jgi:hypothetical protein
MSERQLQRIMFETIIVLALGLLGFMGLAIYNMKVIENQQKLIHDMSHNPACMVDKTGGNRG